MAPAAISLPVPYVRQAATQLCWAACASMVLRYYSRPVGGCTVASWLHPGAVNQRCEIPDIVKIYRNWGLTAVLHVGQLSPAALKEELHNRCPVQIGTSLEGKSGHLFIVYGWTPTSCGDSYLIHDPRESSFKSAAYDYLQAGLGAWRYTWTFV